MFVCGDKTQTGGCQGEGAILSDRGTDSHMDLLICHNWAVKIVSVTHGTRNTCTQHMYSGAICFVVSVKYNQLEVGKRSKGGFNPVGKCVNTAATSPRRHLLFCHKSCQHFQPSSGSSFHPEAVSLRKGSLGAERGQLIPGPAQEPLKKRCSLLIEHTGAKLPGKASPINTTWHLSLRSGPVCSCASVLLNCWSRAKLLHVGGEGKREREHNDLELCCPLNMLFCSEGDKKREKRRLRIQGLIYLLYDT